MGGGPGGGGCTGGGLRPPWELPRGFDAPEGGSHRSVRCVPMSPASGMQGLAPPTPGVLSSGKRGDRP